MTMMMMMTFGSRTALLRTAVVSVNFRSFSSEAATLCFRARARKIDMTLTLWLHGDVVITQAY